MTGIKSSEVLPKLTLAGHTVADSCEFDPAGTITLDPRTLSVCAFKINEQICYEDLETTFLSERMRLGSTSPITPSEFTDFLLARLSTQIGNDRQNVFWNGDTVGASADALLGVCDGLIKLIGASGSGVVPVAGATVTSSNVQAELGKVFAAIPEQIAGTAVIMVPYAIAQAYKVSLAATTGGLFALGEKPLDYNGVPMIVCPYMPANKMVAANPANIWIGTDLESDWASIRVIDTIDTIAEAAVRIFARWKFGVQVGVPAEIVYYKQ